MPKISNRLFIELDAVAARTGIPQLTSVLPRPETGRLRRRRLRWIPLVALLLAAAGLATVVARPDSETGPGIELVNFTIAVMLPLFGPIKPWGEAGVVDEFDRAVRRNAFLAGYMVTSFAALLSLWVVIALAQTGGWSTVELSRLLRTLIFALMTVQLAMPTLHASWAMRPMAED